MKIKINKKFFFSTLLALFSFEIYLGTILGYFFGKFLSFLAGKIRMIIFDLGKYRLHLHHWLISIPFLIFNFFFPLFSPFFFGFFGGLVFQEISCDPNWYKILIKITKSSG